MVGFRVGIVVGEVSGDILGAALITELRKYIPELEVEGVIGEKLLAQGCGQLFAMERLAVMGFIDPIKRLPELYRMRKWLESYFTREPPDLFIGIDAPEFNLGLEKKLKAAAIPTVHYVSPSVWAWRENRINTIKHAVDLMLTLFPFEEIYYQHKNIPAKFVGHPAADKIPFKTDVAAARKKLGLGDKDRIIALLPGSRISELKHMAKVYLQAAKLCAKTCSDLKFIVPLVSVEQQTYFDQLQEKIAGDVSVQSMVGVTYDAIAASDLVIVTSGTATLEVMLHKKPMLIAYKTNFITHALVKRMIKVKYIGLPNLLANAAIVKEFIQTEATPENLYQEVLRLLASPELQQQQTVKFMELHQSLQREASTEAVAAIIKMLGIEHVNSGSRRSW